jgi:hypothetical protein
MKQNARPIYNSILGRQVSKSSLLLQITRNFGELGERGLEIFDDFLRDNVVVGKI